MILPSSSSYSWTVSGPFLRSSFRAALNILLFPLSSTSCSKLLAVKEDLMGRSTGECRGRPSRQCPPQMIKIGLIFFKNTIFSRIFPSCPSPQNVGPASASGEEDGARCAEQPLCFRGAGEGGVVPDYQLDHAK